MRLNIKIATEVLGLYVILNFNTSARSEAYEDEKKNVKVGKCYVTITVTMRFMHAAGIGNVEIDALVFFAVVR